ncbi:MAG: acyltransferase [Gammaproteobacteria bacterium]
MPSPVVTAVFLYKHKCKVSPKAEVELTPLIAMGRGTVISSFAKLKATGPLKIGRDVSVGTCVFISADEGGIEIGDYTMVGPNVSIIGNSYRYDRLDVPIQLQGTTSSGIKIGANVWLGAGTCVIDGAVIGDGAIVAPNSVVSARIPENAIAQGNPAKVVFQRR